LTLGPARRAEAGAGGGSQPARSRPRG